MQAIDDKTIVRDYFNATGFDRWRNIYGDGEVNKVQRDIRVGHQQTIDKVMGWLEADGNLAQLSICDAGCGVGSLSLPLAKAGATVYASDISEKMVEEAKQQAEQTLDDTSHLTFDVKDLEELTGEYHTVICLDVLIHYPDEEMEKMISHLASLANSRIILSFAPKTPCYTLLKKVGEFFPGPSKTTRAYLHKESEVREILEKNGFTLQRDEMTKTRFYFSRLLEATRS
ncbi:magnesium protoporphyrin IX methyltransferase [Spirulina sp. CS-785/01]|uniref:magnesium protoporphyrin IX methyltransferase n=1 Tax=Spirulina sp. CS-785/01 TaxID=3021716 RepID=UPI00232D5DC3|nr:magnesium protoporphyrin IX methyltransferase [Spirulina sp. CS-785/01]MDB9312998.1 magnesium protoporphyrin IX methyltransferase [Spirulina sp. CS-785/01]